MKLTKREIASLTNRGIVKPTISGGLEPVGDNKNALKKAAPLVKTDNSKRSWKVHEFERDWDGYLTSVTISEL